MPHTTVKRPKAQPSPHSLTGTHLCVVFGIVTVPPIPLGLKVCEPDVLHLVISCNVFVGQLRSFAAWSL